MGRHEICWDYVTGVPRAIVEGFLLSETVDLLPKLVTFWTDCMSNIQFRLAVETLAQSALKQTTRLSADVLSLEPTQRSDLFWRLALVLTSAQNASCSDPRDHVFGLLGVAGCFFHDVDISTYIRVDYTESVESMYEDTARCLLEQSRTLNVLVVSEDLHDWAKHRGLPSWVADYRQRDSQGVGSYLEKRSWSASSGVPVKEPPFRVTGSSMICSGVCFDRVDQVWAWKFEEGDEVQKGSTLDYELDVLWSAQTLPAQLERRRKAEVLWQTILLGYGQQGTVTDRIAESYFWSWVVTDVANDTRRCGSGDAEIRDVIIPDFEELLKSYELCEGLSHEDVLQNLLIRTNILQQRSGDSDEFNAFEAEAAIWRRLPGQNITIGTRFSVSKRGLFGLGPQSTQPGDQIWALATADAPLVLRPLEPPGTYSYVGACFILDHMNGEMVSEEYVTKGVLDNYRNAIT